MSAINKMYSRSKEYGIKYVLKIIVRNKIYRRIEKMNNYIGDKIFAKFPLRDVIILESHNDFDSNGGAFYDYLLKHKYNEKYKIIWLLRNKKPSKLPKNVYCFNLFFPSLIKTYYIYTAQYILTCHEVIGSKRKNQKSYYLTHGAVALKAFKGNIDLPDSLTYCLTPSEYMKPIMANQHNILDSNVKQIILGYPSHDILYKKDNHELEKITQKHYTKVVLWMPTFRKPIGFGRNDSDIELPLGIPIFNDYKEFIELNEYLQKNDMLLIIKIHPMQDMNKIKIKSCSNIKVLDGMDVKKLDVDNYRLMRETDALLTDYSAVAYDYLHLNKPIGYTLDDVNDYKLGLIVENPSDLIAGQEIYCLSDFYDFIEKIHTEVDQYAEVRQKVFDRVFKYHDGNSCKRLVQHMNLK